MLTMKQLVIDAICGVGFPSLILAMQCEQLGLASPSGPTDWHWNVDQLQACREEQLQELYEALCEARAEMEALDAPPAQESLILTQ